MDDTNTRPLLARTSRTPTAVRVILDVVRHTVIDDVRQVLHIESSRRHVGSHEELYAVLAEFLHRQVTLLLRKVAMQRVGIVTILYELIGHFLRLHARAAEDDGINLGIIIHNTLQGQVFVLGMHHIIHVVHRFRPLVARAYHDFLGFAQVLLRDTLYLTAHRGREEQCVMVFGHPGQNLVYALREPHGKHLVGFVQHHVFHMLQRSRPTLHQVDQTARRSHNDLYALPQRTDLRFDVRTAVHRQYAHTGQVFGVVLQIIRYLQTKFSGGTQDESLRHIARGIHFLQDGQTVSCCFSGTGLCQRHNVVIHSQQVRNHFLLYRHRVFIPHFLNSLSDFRRNTKLLKSFQYVNY